MGAMVKQFLLRWLVNFLGLWMAANLVSGISYGDKVRYLVLAALIFSIVNALIRPLVIILALPAIVLTLGLFTLVVNTLMLYLVTLLYPRFHVGSFWAALLAVIIIWLVNYFLNDLTHPTNEKPV
jgi:putative membrane protein